MTRGLEQARLAAVLAAATFTERDALRGYQKISGWKVDLAWEAAGRLLDRADQARREAELGVRRKVKELVEAELEEEAALARERLASVDRDGAVPVELVASADLDALRAVARALRAAEDAATDHLERMQIALARDLAHALPPSALGEDPAGQEQPKARTAMDETVLYVYGDRDAYLEGSADPLTPAQLQEWAARFLGMANKAERLAALPGEIDETEPEGGA